jgi:glycosyltransferase involved in cell wall biosynthesis
MSRIFFGWYGAEEVTANLIEGLDPKRFDTILVSLEGTRRQKSLFLRTLEERGVRGIRVSSHWYFSLFQLIGLVRNNSVDIIHTHIYRSDFLGFLTAKMTNKKVMATVHGLQEPKLKLRLMGIGNRFLLRYFDKAIILSKALGIRLKKIEPSRLELIYKSVIPEKLARTEVSGELKMNFFSSSKGDTVAVIGRLSPEKGHRYLFEAMTEITKIKPDLKLLVVGDGPLKSKLVELAEKKRISKNVLFTGYRQDIGNILSLVDLVVVPSIGEGEGCCGVVLEASAYGKPVVASEVGGIIDIAEEYDQIHLVPPKGVKEMAAAILKILSTEKDRSEPSYPNIPGIPEKFSQKRMIEEYERVYVELMSKQPQL